MMAQQLQEWVHRAAREGDAEAIQSLLSGLYTDLLAQTLSHLYLEANSMMTPLAVAAYHGHVDVVRLLVEDFGLDIGQRHSSGPSDVVVCPALISAVRGCHLDTLQFLLAKKCDVDVTDSNDETALFAACNSGRLDIAKLLVRNGASVNAVNCKGQSCLMQVCERNFPQLARYLIDRGADVNCRGNSGWTALHHAASNNALDCIKVLMEKGAKVSHKNTFGTPLLLAATKRSVDAVEYLIQLPFTSPEDRITALELLGARMAKLDRNRALFCLYRAMEERWRDPSNPVLKPLSPFPLLSEETESCTIAELRNRQSSEDGLRLECLAILQRTLGFHSDETREDFMAYYCELRDNSRFHEAVGVLLYYTRHVEWSDARSIYSDLLQHFQVIFREMLLAGIYPKFDHLQDLLDTVLPCMKHHADTIGTDEFLSFSFVQLCLDVILIALKVAQDHGEESQLEEKTRFFMAILPTYTASKNANALHAAMFYYRLLCCGGRKDYDFQFDKLVELLLKCGAKVNGKDVNGDTPLHYVAKCEDFLRDDEMMAEIIRVLLRAGAVPYVRNTRGETFMGLADDFLLSVIREFLPSSLQSLAALCIRQNNIPYQSTLPHLLPEFVELH